MDDFISRFEAGKLTKEEWTHAAHLRMAAWYVFNFSPEEAGEKIRRGIRHLNVCLGGQNTEDAGYHETLTEFWILEVRAHGPEGVTELPADLWKRDYPTDIVKDRRARREYVKPESVRFEG